MDHFLAEKGLHNYEMDKHTRLIYHPVAGVVYKRRFEMAVRVLGSRLPRGTERLVEVGYGAGLLLPTLADMAREVLGMDAMDTRAAKAVKGMLDRLGICNVRLLSGSVTEIPLPEGSVDALLCISVLEHLRGAELKHAAESMRRVLKPGGVAVLGFPVKNAFTRFLFRILGYNDHEIHPSSHTDILRRCSESQGFRVERICRFPGVLPMHLGLYALVRLRRAEQSI
jgi:ubiquinone/menaquinone biosynthesis C-methylase UbiE